MHTHPYMQVLKMTSHVFLLFPEQYDICRRDAKDKEPVFRLTIKLGLNAELTKDLEEVHNQPSRCILYPKHAVQCTA